MALPKLNRLKIISLSLLLTWAFFTVNVKSALAHYPHDDIFAVEISPNYEQDRTLFIDVRGNLFKSQDGGNSWQTVVNGLDHQSELSALKIAPQSSKVVYLATLGDGVYKSDDGGDFWHKVIRGLDTLNIDSIAIASNSSELVLAAGTESGLYLTSDGGANWSSVMNNKITAISFTPQDHFIVGDGSGNLYASQDRGRNWQQLASLDSGAIAAVAISPQFASDRTFWVGTEQGIWQTVDGGVSFTPVNSLGDRKITSLAISPNFQKDKTIFAATWNETFRSSDGGKSWKKSSKGLTTDGQAELPHFNRPHFSDLSISPTYKRDKTLFVAGFDGLFKSTDRGRVWQEVSTLSPNIIVGFDLSPDYLHNPSVAVTTYLGGAYLSDDGGDSWNTINRGLAKDPWFKRIPKQILQTGYIARSFDIAFSPNYRRDNTLFSPSWTYFLKSTARGRQWQKIPITLESNRPTKYAIAVSPSYATDRTIYLGSMRGTGEDYILKSTDGGQNFSVVGDINGQAVVYLAISPNFAADKTLYAGVKDGIYRTVDGGQTWQATGRGMPKLHQESKLAISPNYRADRTVFAGTTAGLFISRDAGNSWESATIGEDSYIEGVAISPAFESDRTLMVSVKGRGLFKSNDGGTTWIQVGSKLLANNHSLANMYGFWPPTMAIAFSPGYAVDRTIYGVAETKLFKSTDSGETWTNLAIPMSSTTSLMQSVTYYYHRLTTSAIAKFLLAATVALISYFALGRLKSSRLPLRKFIKATGAFTAFTLTFMLFSV